MSVIGIVCEYNPFHNGHEYHIRISRNKLGEDSPVICVMSGDFVQRGEPAVYSKFARAEAACLCGANLVIELPVPWALSSAESFARGSVALLSSLGATHISFGSESGEVEVLEKIARTLLEPQLNNDIKLLLNQNPNMSYAFARQLAAEERLGELSRQMEMPNNILAIEYLKAIYELRLDINPMTVQRCGGGHDRVSNGPGPKSASELRSLIFKGKVPTEYIPGNAAGIYEREREQGREISDRGNFEIAMLSRLRMFSPEYFSSLPDGADGAGMRLYKACRSESSLNAILARTKTKRYAMSRIRRMCLNACLGVKAGMNEGVPPYARVLAADETGCALLKNISKKQSIPIITKPASVKALGSECSDLFELGAYAHDLYTLGFSAEYERKVGLDWQTSPKIVKSN